MKTEVLIELKKQGVQNIASVVAKHFNTTYYHVVSIESLIENDGKWIGAPKQCHTFKNGGYKNIRIGVSSKNVDWNCTILKTQYAKNEKDFLLKDIFINEDLSISTWESTGRFYIAIYFKNNNTVDTRYRTSNLKDVQYFQHKLLKELKEMF